MTHYNPNVPNILGLEFVPIADRVVPLDLGAEFGWSFHVTGAPGSLLDLTQFGGAEEQPNAASGPNTTFFNVYPRGREDDTGQIAVLTLTPVSMSVTGATGDVSSLQNPGNSTGVVFDATTDRIRCSFDISDVEGINQAALLGKRILGIDIRYQVAGTPGFALEPTLEDFVVAWPYGPFMTGPAQLDQVPEPAALRIGEINPWWDRTTRPTSTAERFPWRYEELHRLDFSDAQPIFLGVRVDTLPLSGQVTLGYLALDIYYCEESRVMYGGSTGISGSVILRNTSFQTTGSLSPGDYTATVSKADGGDYYNTATFPVWEMTQLYELSSHPAVRVEKFKRPTGGLPALPPVSSSTDKVHGFIIGSYVSQAYTDQIEIPVYINPSGLSIYARQQISNLAAISDTTYEYVRFYARRFNPLAPGDLTISVSGTGSATITPAEFAALDELTIGDYGPGTGWREVTLPITAVFSSDNSPRNVTFTMTGVSTSTPIDQWQLIGAEGFTTAVYDSPSARNLTSKMPFDSETNPSTTPARTAVVMFSQMSPEVTGFAVTGAGCALDVQQVGTGCADPSSCVPTHILANRLGWNLNVTYDTFTRTEVNGWGTSDSGDVWSNTGGTSADFSVDGSRGVHSVSAVNSSRRTFTDGPLADGEIMVTVEPSVLATGGFIEMCLMARYIADGDQYLGIARFETNGTISARINENAGGSVTTLASSTTTLTYAAGTQIRMKFRFVGSQLSLKLWRVEDPEPVGWTVEATDTTLTTGSVGCRSILSSANTNTLPVALYYDDFISYPYTLTNGSLEIQRMDEIDDDWQTIVDTEEIWLQSFCDYEARAGMTSWYRMRTVNLYDFAGAWVTGAAYLPSPAVSGVGDGNSVLIFTSNRAPESSLAYVMQFGNDPIEEFGFPEAGFQQLRTQYQKDYFTAFRPLERGGEAFTRDILINNTAIPPESLANFRSLRDLAWATLPYVCVRDELGNRWFANVLVPSGRVRNNRTTYIAQVQITEVTDTPAPYTGG